jgi:hypothetical protein
MITQTSFLGLPLRTQRQRRLLVVLYYALFLALSALFFWKSLGSIGVILPQVFTLGGMLGGIKIGGPVKVYQYPHLPLALDGPIQTLNLEDRKPFNTVGPEGWSPLDERELTQRDFAHFTAYRILRWTLGFACCLYWLAYANLPAWLSNKGPILAWTLLVYVLSLPQSVLLWTEPNAPTADIIEIPSTP